MRSVFVTWQFWGVEQQRTLLRMFQCHLRATLGASEWRTASLMASFLPPSCRHFDHMYRRCENCKVMAPSMREIEEQFKNQINFVVVDGTAEKNFDLVRFSILRVVFRTRPARTHADTKKPFPVSSWRCRA